MIKAYYTIHIYRDNLSVGEIETHYNQPERKAHVLRTEEKGCHQREIKKKFEH